MFLVLYGMLEDLMVAHIVHGEILVETVIVSFLIAFIFTLAAEIISKRFKVRYPR